MKRFLKSFPLSFHLYFKNSVDDNAEGEEEEVFGVKQEGNTLVLLLF